MALITLRNISKIYPIGSQQIVAVDALNLTINRREFAVLAGPSGSGKTTVLNIVGALDSATEGTVTVAGENYQQMTAKERADFRLQRIGFIFQSYNLIPVLTAAENAEFILMLQGIPAQLRRRQIEKLFTELGIGGLEDRRPNDLSGGQQQRVAIARAIAPQPAVILADEPTANLDSRTAEDLLELMRGLNRDKGMTFLFSSHDPLVIAHAARVIRLRDGRLEEDSSTPDSL
ncbi:MAG: macrolide ABC transporter ATP-binding protein [Desulfuromonas sp.]|nr:MAG: macrolide ABC transporter ATP-binding protein [Desulfuromonas sp.]